MQNTMVRGGGGNDQLGKKKLGVREKNGKGKENGGQLH